MTYLFTRPNDDEQAGRATLVLAANLLSDVDPCQPETVGARCRGYVVYSL